MDDVVEGANLAGGGGQVRSCDGGWHVRWLALQFCDDIVAKIEVALHECGQFSPVPWPGVCLQSGGILLEIGKGGMDLRLRVPLSKFEEEVPDHVA